MKNSIEKQASAPLRIFENVFFALLANILVFGALRIVVEGNLAFLLRGQQVAGGMALLFWYGAVTLSLFYYFTDVAAGKKPLRGYERTALICAVSFVLSHVFLGITYRLGGIDKLQFLPALFKWSLSFGLVALIALCLYSILVGVRRQVDKVSRRVAIAAQWLYYVVFLLVFLHVWMIGTHVAQKPFKQLLFVMLTTIITPLLYFLVKKALGRHWVPSRIVVYGVGFIVVIVAGYGVQNASVLVESYGSAHQHDEDAQVGGGHGH